MADPPETEWRFLRFGLIVTGTGERSFLPQFLRALAEGGHCTFEVIRKIGQRSPITSPKRILKMVGTHQKIPDLDADEIGLPARNYIQRSSNNFVILLDDLEHSRVARLPEVFERYRNALDTMLQPFAINHRASVHFLANMLEAYYFSHSAAVNAVLKTNLADYAGDVEKIRHPKGDLEAIFTGFNEITHGAEIVKRLDMVRVLSRLETCASLRSLFAWCWLATGEPAGSRFQLDCGIYNWITGRQIKSL